ncbi:unnamed protein product, partial [Mesorhabditis belari]|uniref:Uncharacterized protein n=1 Tax=Mesorhabditis belari TaxID=2138241 RepID=A0AAF3F6J6_9BILA
MSPGIVVQKATIRNKQLLEYPTKCKALSSGFGSANGVYTIDHLGNIQLEMRQSAHHSLSRRLGTIGDYICGLGLTSGLLFSGYVWQNGGRIENRVVCRLSGQQLHYGT